MRVLKSENSRVFIAGSAIGAAIFILVFGLSFLNPLNDSFISSGYLEKDIAQHYAGWLLFRDSPWQLPLGVGQNIAYPYGASVSFTDSVPLFALFFKAIRFALPQVFQYFGIFTFMSFVLQGGFAAILANIFCKKLYFSVTLALLFCTFPIFVERAARHTALTAQWLIVAALYYYFKNARSCFKKYLPFFSLNLLAISIHPYFLPFTFAIMLAAVIRDIVRQKRYKAPIISLAASLCGVLGAGGLLGAFTKSGTATGLYGYFSMNLNAYFNPSSLGFSNWSRILPPLSQGDGQYDGFNYLGIGVLFGIVFSAIWIVKNYRIALSLASEHVALISVCACLTAFAITPTVLFSSHTIVSVDLPYVLRELCTVFRASGRFGWLLGYLLALSAFIFSHRLFGDKLGKILVFTLVAVQILDSSAALVQKHVYFYSNASKQSHQMPKTTLTSSFWHNEIFSYYLSLEKGAPALAADIAVLAAKNGKVVNIQFAARESDILNEAYMAKLNNEISNGMVYDDTLYFAVNPTRYAFAQKSGKIRLYEADGRFILASRAHDDKLTSGGAVPISPDTLYAQSYNDAPYASGVYNELNVIMVFPPAFMYEKILAAKTITNGDITANVDKVTQEDNMLYIFLKDDVRAEQFAYPKAFWIQE